VHVRQSGPGHRTLHWIRNTASSLTVDAQSNIFAAEASSIPGDGTGEFPPSISLSSSTNQVVTFPSVTGSVNCEDTNPNNPSNGPDGTCQNGPSTNVSGAGGISGLIDSQASFFLVGVFLASSQPSTAPPALDFSAGANGQSFLTLRPQLGQVFFIGDGLTGTGTGDLQQFVVPSGATQLFLGFVDSCNLPGGSPGCYYDNSGSFSVTANVSTITGPLTNETVGGGSPSQIPCNCPTSQPVNPDSGDF
jgi:hypothetical protein